MLLYRCTACTRDHYGQQPATCQGCGLGSFALIPLAPLPVEVVETSPGFPDELKAEVAAAFDDDAPPTPRDMPEQPGPIVLEGDDEPGRLDTSEVPAVDEASREAREALDEQGEEATVAALRPVVAKAAGVCSQLTCDAPATHRFTWPGHPEAHSCHAHALKAVMLAEHMGFFLEAAAL